MEDGARGKTLGQWLSDHRLEHTVPQPGKRKQVGEDGVLEPTPPSPLPARMAALAGGGGAALISRGGAPHSPHATTGSSARTTLRLDSHQEACSLPVARLSPLRQGGGAPPGVVVSPGPSAAAHYYYQLQQRQQQQQQQLAAQAQAQRMHAQQQLHQQQQLQWQQRQVQAQQQYSQRGPSPQLPPPPAALPYPPPQPFLPLGGGYDCAAGSDPSTPLTALLNAYFSEVQDEGVPLPLHPNSEEKTSLLALLQEELPSDLPPHLQPPIVSLPSSGEEGNNMGTLSSLSSGKRGARAGAMQRVAARAGRPWYQTEAWLRGLGA